MINSNYITILMEYNTRVLKIVSSEHDRNSFACACGECEDCFEEWTSLHFYYPYICVLCEDTGCEHCEFQEVAA